MNRESSRSPNLSKMSKSMKRTNTTNIPTTNTVRNVYSRFKNEAAPSWIAFAIPLIVSFPSSSAITALAFTSAKTSPMSPTTIDK